MFLNFVFYSPFSIFFPFNVHFVFKLVLLYTIYVYIINISKHERNGITATAGFV